MIEDSSSDRHYQQRSMQQPIQRRSQADSSSQSILNESVSYAQMGCWKDVLAEKLQQVLGFINSANEYQDGDDFHLRDVLISTSQELEGIVEGLRREIETSCSNKDQKLGDFGTSV